MSVTQQTDLTFEPVHTNHYRVRNAERAVVDPHLFADGPILESVRNQEDQSLKQLLDAASLPGVRYVAGMPDVHQGYGVPVGCVMAMDADEGLVSAGAVGMDINCGVRLLRSDIPADSLDADELKDLGRAILKRVPVGIGTSSPYGGDLEPREEDILLNGVEALRDTRFVREGDTEGIQDHGCYPGARLDPITSDARDRLDQFGTLGGGNHFLEIVEVDELTDKKAGSTYELSPGTLGFLIHTGSRGFGHQICVDYSEQMNASAGEFGLSFPTGELASAPIDSDLGQEYLGAMACAANVAYVNRQIITFSIRQACREIFSDRSRPPTPEPVYDITHNLARFETVGNERYLVHRKGAVRSLPGGHPDNPDRYAEVGHPVIVPGNMALGSYVMRAGDRVRDSLFSVNHGAGRTMSRSRAKEEISEQMLLDALGDIQLLGAARTKILDEAPQAYKDIHNVVDVLVRGGIARTVAHLRPRVVIKGD